MHESSVRRLLNIGHFPMILLHLVFFAFKSDRLWKLSRHEHRQYRRSIANISGLLKFDPQKEAVRRSQSG